MIDSSIENIKPPEKDPGDSWFHYVGKKYPSECNFVFAFGIWEKGM